MTGKMANRADLIIKILMTQSGASIKELSEHLGVSEITIRRDLHVLERQGRLRLINGGRLPCAGRSGICLPGI
mgnify:CR=1 FL=1